jgi:hypothetical protein
MEVPFKAVSKISTAGGGAPSAATADSLTAMDTTLERENLPFRLFQLLRRPLQSTQAQARGEIVQITAMHPQIACRPRPVAPMPGQRPLNHATLKFLGLFAQRKSSCKNRIRRLRRRVVIIRCCQIATQIKNADTDLFTTRFFGRGF